MKINDTTLNLQVFEQFQGQSFLKIAREVGVNPALISTKTSVVTVLNKLLVHVGFDKKQAIERCRPMQLSIKTIKLNESGGSKESMSFEQVDFVEMYEETWETSYLKKKFKETVFLFFVFQYKKDASQTPVLHFRGVKLWRMPEEILNREVKSFWELTHQILDEGVELKEKIQKEKTIVKNNLPGSKDNLVLHIRPKAKDSNDKVQLPDGNFITKQAYWINASYAADIVKDLPPFKADFFKKEYPNHKKSADFKSIRKLLSKEVYSIEEFLEIAENHKIDIDDLDITTENLREIGFKIEPGVVLSENVESLNVFLMQTIFKENYFVVPDLPVFQLDHVKRKISNLENAHQLIDVGDGIYLTNKELRKDGLNKKVLQDYKHAVAEFIGTGKFFTLNHLYQNGFTHEIDEYGFEPIFYESILKGQGYFKSLKIANKSVFAFTFENVSIKNYVSFLMKDNQCMNVEETIDAAQKRSGLQLDYDEAITLLRNSGLFYSEDLEKIFRDKEIYYKEVLGLIDN
ncbi:hypothetical protein M1Q06_15145 [Planococcus sp. 11815]|uniref:MutH/Sau3AI family endonuclease n=1 Tax=Planococcus sp. 11815 TaxID=2939413 RepID=UPI003DA1D303